MHLKPLVELQIRISENSAEVSTDDLGWAFDEPYHREVRARRPGVGAGPDVYVLHPPVR